MKIAAAAQILALVQGQDNTKSKDPEVRRVSLKIVNAPITAIVQQLREETGIPIEFDENAKKRIEGDDSYISVELKDTTLLATLRLVCLPRILKAVSVEKKKILITSNP